MAAGVTVSVKRTLMGMLVTGGAGFVGSHIVLALLEAGENVLVLDNLSTGFRRAVPNDTKFVKGDVGDHHLVTCAAIRLTPLFTVRARPWCRRR
jgi:UDP-glucose 4-epimerase